MEFDGNLTKLQGTLYSLGSQGLLNKRDSFQNVVNALKKITENLPDEAKSKLTFFMVLSTQLAVSEKLRDDNFVGLFINITPHIEKEYLIHYVYHLNLQLHLFKVIENCLEALSLELLDVIIKNLKEPDFHKDEFGVKHLYQLWQSVFVKICKINVGFHLGDSSVKFLVYFKDIYDLIQKVFIITVEMGNLEKLVGFHLYYYFRTVLYCIKLYKNPIVSDDPIYKLSIQYDEEKHVSDFNIKVCINLIFDKIFKIMEVLTLDLWMTLSECYFVSDSKNSLQLLIGGLVFDILNEVKDFNLSPDVLNCLSNFAINKLDVMMKADLDEIIENINSGRKEWFEILVRHSDFTQKKSVECLLDNLKLANLDNLNVILNTSYEYLSSCKNHENSDVMKNLFLSALKKKSDYSYWLERVFIKYQPDFLTTAHTHDEIIETFNKISKENVSEGNLVSLCMQSPLDTIRKICQIAVCGSQQTEFIIEILKFLKPACNVSPFEGFTLLGYVLLKILLEEITDKEKQSFINFVAHLNKEKLLDSSFFNNSLKALKEYLENETLEKAVHCLEIIKVLLNSRSFHVEKPAFLVFMSQVLGQFSWNLKTFSTIKATGRDVAICIITFIMRGLNEVNEAFRLLLGRLEISRFLNIYHYHVIDCNSEMLTIYKAILGSDFQWARQEILKSWEVNQSCFCDLWFSCGLIWQGHRKFHSCVLALAHSQRRADDLRKFLISFDEPFQVRVSLVLSLTTLLPSITFRGWNSIFSHLIIISESMNCGKNDIYHDVLDMFASSLYVLTLKLRESREIFSCHKYCLRNFARLIKSYCPKINRALQLRVFEKTVLILKTIQDDEERKSCWEIISPAWIEFNIVETNNEVFKELLPLLDGVADVLVKSHGQKLH